ncbi:hypothetical protein GPALN_006320 [Globodera pallida]|nr:hypothetical protein GPALN_006320 [Globodera pallida]
MRFIHPFPASQLSSDDLLCAVSAWLTPPIDDEAGNAGADCSSTTVPMVFSHDEWFVQCVPTLGELLGKLLLREEHQQQQWNEECQVLRYLLGLTVRIPMRTRSREEMQLFIVLRLKTYYIIHFIFYDVFGTLLCCSSQPTQERPRRLAQKTLVVLLKRFEPVAQFLLLSRLFQLLLLRAIPLSNPEYEPQLLAWLVDIYRTKCYAREEQDDEGSSAASIAELFQAQLCHFYSQIREIVFDDPLASVNFYTSVCLLLTAHALHRQRLTLLRNVGPSWVCRVREQLRDWRSMDEANKRLQQRSHNDDDMAIKQMITTDEQQKQGRLNMLAFQLEEAGRRCDEALNVHVEREKSL